jgi:dihydrofolate synthase/folylpolyglutamate synthase
MLGRKDARGFFERLKPLGPRILTTGFSSPNATPPDALAEAARAAGLAADVVDGVEAGVAAAAGQSGPTPHIVMAGSLHFAGDVLGMSPETWPV